MIRFEFCCTTAVVSNSLLARVNYWSPRFCYVVMQHLRVILQAYSQCLSDNQ